MANKRITISVDSSADLTKDLCEKYDIQTLSMGVVIGDKSFKDYIDVTPQDVYNAVEKLKIMPKSQAVSELDYAEVFEKNKKSACHIHLSVSDKLSCSHENACRAASKYANVHVINSKVMSAGITLLAIRTREMEDAGLASDEIITKLQELVKKTNASFIVDKLVYLYKGGRVSGLKLLGANLLKIHPQLVCNRDGSLGQGKKFRGNFEKIVDQYVKHVINNAPNASKDLCMLTYTDTDPKLVEHVESAVLSYGFKRVIKTVAGSSITCHCGRNTIGLMFNDV